MEARAHSKQSELAGGFAAGEQPIVIPAPSLVSGRAMPPLMLNQGVPQNDKQGGQGADENSSRYPDSKWNQDDAHGSQGNPVLQQATQALQEFHRPITRLVASPVQMVIELGLVV